MKEINEESYSQLITEGKIIDAAVVFMIVSRLIKPFRKWKAFKLGLIDEKGNIIRQPKLPAEKNALTFLDKLILKLKKLIGKAKLAVLSPLILLASGKEEQGGVLTEEDATKKVEHERSMEFFNKKLKTLTNECGIELDEYIHWKLSKKSFDI